jgi:hypothetical protein
MSSEWNNDEIDAQEMQHGDVHEENPATTTRSISSENSPKPPQQNSI